MQHFRDEIHIVDVVSTLTVRENRLIFAAQRTEDSVGLCLLERSDRGEQKRVETIGGKVEAKIDSEFRKSARHQLFSKCRFARSKRFTNE
jgi:hypothetical protein